MAIMAWQDLWVALALVMVLEGVLPFLTPKGLRQVYGQMSQMSDRSLRLYGLLSMIVGVVFLSLVS